jgi:hypothetical protein
MADIPNFDGNAKMVSGGILVFVIFLPIYAAGLFFMCKILGWDLRWTQCSGLVAIAQVMRLMDRLLFYSGRQT